MEEKMNTVETLTDEESAVITEHVEQSREELRQLFGDAGLHSDCRHFRTSRGIPFCSACIHCYNKHKKTAVLQCEAGVCYFYQPKEKNK